jgi:hypothetical protein
MEKSSIGLQAFARYYIDVYNYALGTGDTDLLESLATDACSTCAAYVKQVQDAYAAGGRIDGGYVKVLSSGAPPLIEGMESRVDLKIDIAKERDLDSRGTLVKTFPGEKASFVVLYPRWRSGRWILNALKAGVAQ